MELVDVRVEKVKESRAILKIHKGAPDAGILDLLHSTTTSEEKAGRAAFGAVISAGVVTRFPSRS
jgi:hypothetical protein